MSFRLRLMDWMFGEKCPKCAEGKLIIFRGGVASCSLCKYETEQEGGLLRWKKRKQDQKKTLRS